MGLAPGDDHNDKDALINSHALSWEEIAKLLKQVPCFTEFEPHLADLMDFFWLTHQFFMDIIGNPSITVVVNLPCGTSEFVLSHIQLMEDYTIFETAKVVSPAPSQFESSQCLTFNICFNIVQVVAGICNLMRQRALVFKRLEVTKAMRAFFAQRLGSNEELRTQLKRAESNLATTQKATVDRAKLLKEADEERKVANVEAC